MRSTITAIQMAIRAAFVVQLALGLAFWTGNALGLVDLHQLIGILIVLGLWTQAALAAQAGVQPGMVAAAVVLGLTVIVVGLTQQDLLPGSAHVVIEVLHLLLGVGAVGLAENLATRPRPGWPRWPDRAGRRARASTSPSSGAAWSGCRWPELRAGRRRPGGRPGTRGVGRPGVVLAGQRRRPGPVHHQGQHRVLGLLHRRAGAPGRRHRPARPTRPATC